MSSIILSFSVFCSEGHTKRRLEEAVSQRIRLSAASTDLWKAFQRGNKVKTDPDQVIENLIGHVDNFNKLNLMTVFSYVTLEDI